jgi:hypothetical protein
MSSTEHPIFQAIRSIRVQDLYETAFTAELNQLMGGNKRRYPMGTYTGECDVVFPTDSGETWVEVKHVYTYHSQLKPYVKNDPSNWLFHKSGCNALKDLTEKLPKLLNQPGVGAIGFLLVIFDSERFPFPTELLDRLRAQAHPEARWREYQIEPWENPNIRDPRSFIRAHYWERPASR